MEPNKDKYPKKEREHWHHLLDSTVWNEFNFRDDDIVISAYSKFWDDLGPADHCTINMEWGGAYRCIGSISVD